MPENLIHAKDIPHPPLLPFIKNGLLIFGSFAQKLCGLEKKYGSPLQILLPNCNVIVVSSPELVKDISDSSKFEKKVPVPISKEICKLLGYGLFTAKSDDPEWLKAHNVLMPGFSDQAMKSYFPKMCECIENLSAKWFNIPENVEFNLFRDVARLTLETIGLCAFSYRLNNFYLIGNHPFIDVAKQETVDAMSRAFLPDFLKRMRVWANYQTKKNVAITQELIHTIIQERKANPEKYVNSNDFLNLMLTSRDKASGEYLSDENMLFQSITFLAAGMGPPACLISCAIYLLLKHPEILKKAQEQVDSIMGSDPKTLPSYEQIPQLNYIRQILQEALRLYPPLPGYMVSAKTDTVIGNKYFIPKDQFIYILSFSLHRNQHAWGAFAESFIPERFSPERFSELDPNAYKPFGNGLRTCLGQRFGLLEATLALSVILHRYHLKLKDGYTLKLQEGEVIEPIGLFVSISKRHDHAKSLAVSVPVQQQTVSPTVEEKGVKEQTKVTQGKKIPLLVLFGSNLGTTEEFAKQFSQQASSEAFDIQVSHLDKYMSALPTQGAVVIIASTYNGEPPDNASKFSQWLLNANLPSNGLQGVRYALLGVGNTNWDTTYQHFPKFIETHLTRLGAKAIIPRTEVNTNADAVEVFKQWSASLCSKLPAEFDIVKETQAVETVTVPRGLDLMFLSESDLARPSVLARLGELKLEVLVNNELQTNETALAPERSTRHVEFKLPPQAKYNPGDYLGVFGQNQFDLVLRVLDRFGLEVASFLKINADEKHNVPFLPVNVPLAVVDLLGNYFELQEPATRDNIKLLATYTHCPPEKEKLLSLSGDDEASRQKYRKEVFEKHKSLLDLLEEFPSVEAPFNVYLSLLPQLKPRFYSISSSSLHKVSVCSLTVGVLNLPSLIGKGEFNGMCSNYLSSCKPGVMVSAFISQTKYFKLPTDKSLPIVMICAGTGYAPFRGFLQERAIWKQQGTSVGKALLFFGCRHPKKDYIYQDEFEEFSKQGIVTVFPAFSRVDNQVKNYTQDVLWEQKETVWNFLQERGIIYVCGDANKLVKGIKEMVLKIYQDKTGGTAEQAQQWHSNLLKQGRYIVDMWSSY